MPQLHNLNDPNPHPGKLIAFEGLGGAGKSTQARLVERWLAGLGCRVFYSEWESSVLTRAAMARGKEEQLFTPTTLCLLYATDFADRYERQILPMLKAGFIVLCDRYVFWSLASDAVRGCDGAWLRRLYAFAVRPDVTFHLDLPLPVAIGRYQERLQDLNYFEAGMDLGLSQDVFESFRIFQGRVQDEYLKQIREFGFEVVDASRPIPQQQRALREAIAARIDLTSFREKSS